MRLRTAALPACLLLAVGCGSTGARTADSSAPTVFAAASLSKVFSQIDPTAKYTFGGSDALQRQIEQGAPADVFAAASPKQPAALYGKGLVEKPVEFATNTLVLIVPRSNPARIQSVGDITRAGVKLVVCNATVPCGDYARTALANLGISAAAMRHVVSQTTDVTQTVAEVALGQADAGFVYLTDAGAAKGRVAVISLPPQAKPAASDYIAVVKGSENHRGAEAFASKVLSPRGQAALRAAGFGRP